ncbi:helix-turn-helix domain-containing protein [Deinococcus budaensis]|uniref:Transcriptional regulator with XRE-family HTH domain n=1 Tax=Deinococcus budaensis TaxID=1665626 RepID=A0A7W8GD06_9DEIO|nr:helix-turn-helix transcriptional regulator [Deinococcus budaensis]MBB5233189.1 transcriptional regulator with XRE-family HTH domain [Deinococcus budaensis]
MFVKTGFSAEEAGQLLRRKRRALDLTLEDVVARSNVPSKQYLSKLESGTVHPGRSRYVGSLAPVLGLSEQEMANITNQPRPMEAVDLLRPSHLDAVGVLAGLSLPPLGAYVLEREPGIIVMDATEDEKRLVAGRQYVMILRERPQGTQVFLRARALREGEASLVLATSDRLYRPDEVRIVGRIVFEGQLL